MKFEDAFLDELKDRIRLSDVVGKSVQLKRAGRELVGLSPFTNEKTPSFYVNDEKRFWHDFSAGKNGDVITFVMETQRLEFVEAVKQLAAIAGMEMPERDGRAGEQDRRRRALEDWLQQAKLWFETELRGPAGREARAYLEARGLGPEEWDRFGIGYAPNGNTALKDFLIIQKGAEQATLVEAGLLATSDDSRPPYDRYRHRIMFPIWSASGRLISFGARALDPKARAKYLNGPDSPIFDKSQHLYGLDMARKMLAGGDVPLLAVEGYMDVIACLRAGIAACATMGTSLTEAQLELMWRHHPAPTLCFDGDSAGRRAASRALDIALPKIGPKRSLRFSAAVGGKDPDQVLREQGPDVLRRQMSAATPLVDFLFDREYGAEPLNSPERWADLKARLKKAADTVPDRALGREYMSAFYQRLAERRTPGRAPATAGAMESAKALRDAPPPLAAALAYWVVREPARALDICEQLEVSGFGHAALDQMAREIVSWLMGAEPDGEKLAQHLHARGFGAMVNQLSDATGQLAQPQVWRRTYQRFIDYQGLERAVQQAKASITTSADMQNFVTLKAQRDAAKRALTA